MSSQPSNGKGYIFVPTFITPVVFYILFISIMKKSVHLTIQERGFKYDDLM